MPDPTPIYVESETNLIKAAQMAKAREIDFVQQFAHNSLAKLIEILGVTRKIPMMEGTTMYLYTTTGTLQSGAVPEGEIIPLSQYATTKTPVGEITLKKWRKAVSAEAIKKSGYEAIIINNNPETVSTDYTTADKLYFDYGNTVKSESLYSEQLPGGFIQVYPNTMKEDSKVNIEALFNAVHKNKETLKALFADE